MLHVICPTNNTLEKPHNLSYKFNIIKYKKFHMFELTDFRLKVKYRIFESLVEIFRKKEFDYDSEIRDDINNYIDKIMNVVTENKHVKSNDIYISNNMIVSLRRHIIKNVHKMKYQILVCNEERFNIQRDLFIQNFTLTCNFFELFDFIVKLCNKNENITYTYDNTQIYNLIYYMILQPEFCKIVYEYLINEHTKLYPENSYEHIEYVYIFIEKIIGLLDNKDYDEIIKYFKKQYETIYTDIYDFLDPIEYSDCGNKFFDILK